MTRNMISWGACILLSAVAPASAQQTGDLSEDAAYQKLQSDFAAAYNRGDAVAMANFFSENAVRITPSGIFKGRDAILANMKAAIAMGLHDYSVKRSISRTEGGVVLNAGEWQAKLGDHPFHGYYSAIVAREGGEVKILEETVNVAAPEK